MKKREFTIHGVIRNDEGTKFIDVTLGNYLMWKGKLVQVIAMLQHPAVVMEYVNAKDNAPCPHCNRALDRDQITVVVDSRQFAENVKPVRTIQETKE